VTPPRCVLEAAPVVQPAGRLRYTAAHRPARIVPPIWMQSGPSWSS